MIVNIYGKKVDGLQIRNTVQKQLVLDTVRSMRNHPTADEVYTVIRAGHPSVSKATVYRNLHQLAAKGDILHIPVPGGADRFDFCTDEHYHVRCKSCGGVYDVRMPKIEGLIEKIEESSGVEVTNYDILFEGICESCKVKNN